MSKEKLYIFDTTLRDGAQTQGIDFSIDDKEKISNSLDTLGVDYIEGGWPGANPTDTEFFNKDHGFKNAKLTAFGMTKKSEHSAENDPMLASLINSKSSSVCLFGKSWDFQVEVALGITNEENLENISESTKHIVSSGKEFMFDAEHFFDGYKANPDYALKCLKAAFDHGARWIILCDTNGGTLPYEVTKIVSDTELYIAPGYKAEGFTNYKTVRTIMGIFSNLYSLRTCSFDLSSKNIENKKYKVCLEFHIGNCLGGCEGKQTEDNYQIYISNIRDFLKGKISSSINYFKNEMNIASENLNFEKAQRAKEKIDLLNNYQSKSTVVDSKLKSIDVFSIISDATHAYVNYLQVAYEARMAALDLTEDWSNGPTKPDLRDYQSGFSLHPSSNIWSQILDSEPTALSQVDGSICFSTINRGIYKIDGESNEIWRAEIPKWSEIKKINTFDEIVAFLSYEERLVLMSKAGGFAIIDGNGNLDQKGVLKLPEVITGFQYEKELGWFIKLNGKYFATLSSLTDSPKIYKVLGPVYDVKNIQGEWFWTGWRHDGKLTKEGKLITETRENIGIGIVGENVLTNDGKWEKIRV